MADMTISDQRLLYMTAQAWTHEKVIRQLDRFITNVNSESMTARNLQKFRDSYMHGCKLTFRDFEEQYRNTYVKWIMMKKLTDPESTLNELTAKLAIV
jgi:hypothetical protein